MQRLLVLLSVGYFLASCASQQHAGRTTAAATAAPSKPYNDRLLVVGGGGSRGAWGAGYAKRLTNQYGPYRVVFGTSTGSLMAPLIVRNQFDTLRRAYTGVTQDSIFNLNPFNEATGGLRGFSALRRVFGGAQSFGDTKNLLKLIHRFMTYQNFQEIVKSEDSLAVFVSVVDFHSGRPSYPCSRQFLGKNPQDSVEKYKLFCKWIWASANEPLFMPYFEWKGGAYVDGGVRENVPLSAALDYAYNHPEIKHIDVIINKPLNPLHGLPFPKGERGVGKGLFRLIDLWNLEVRDNDVMLPLLRILAQDQQDARAELENVRRELIETKKKLEAKIEAREKAITAAQKKKDKVAEGQHQEAIEVLKLAKAAVDSAQTSLYDVGQNLASDSLSTRTAPSSQPASKDLITITLHYFPPRLFQKVFKDNEGFDIKINQKELLFDRTRMEEMWNAGEAGEEDPEKPQLPLRNRTINSNTFTTDRNLLKSATPQVPPINVKP